MKRESIHYQHEVTYYVPCYFTNDDGYPSFKYHMGDATQDEQMCASMSPDYILILKGQFDAKTQPYDEDVTNYNKKGK